MIEIINTICDAVHSAIPQLTKSVSLAKIDSQGRILVKHSGQNEYSFAGIHDHDSGYFYVRHRNDGKIFFGPASGSVKPVTYFQNFFKIEYQLRLVACVRNADPYLLETAIRGAVMNASLPNSAVFQNCEILPVQSIIDPISVVIAESPDDVLQPFDKNLTFVAFDFDLTGNRDFALDKFCENPCDPSNLC